jgi:hypothetical protein
VYIEGSYSGEDEENFIVHMSARELQLFGMMAFSVFGNALILSEIDEIRDRLSESGVACPFDSIQPPVLMTGMSITEIKEVK